MGLALTPRRAAAGCDGYKHQRDSVSIGERLDFSEIPDVRPFLSVMRLSP